MIEIKSIIVILFCYIILGTHIFKFVEQLQWSDILITIIT